MVFILYLKNYMNNLNLTKWQKKEVSKVMKSLKAISTIKKDLVKRNLILELWRLDRLRGHKFITKAILNKAETVWRQEEEDNPNIIVKYFSPNTTWYITEIDINNEALAFGYVVDEQTKEGELWNINIKELSIIKNQIRMPIERDLFFWNNKRINDIKKKKITNEMTALEENILEIYRKNAWCPTIFREKIKPFLKHLAPIMTYDRVTIKTHKALNKVFADWESRLASEYLPEDLVKSYFKEIWYSSL